MCDDPLHCAASSSTSLWAGGGASAARSWIGGAGLLQGLATLVRTSFSQWKVEEDQAGRPLGRRREVALLGKPFRPFVGKRGMPPERSTPALGRASWGGCAMHIMLDLLKTTQQQGGRRRSFPSHCVPVYAGRRRSFGSCIRRHLPPVRVCSSDYTLRLLVQRRSRSKKLCPSFSPVEHNTPRKDAKTRCHLKAVATVSSTVPDGASRPCLTNLLRGQESRRTSFIC